MTSVKKILGCLTALTQEAKLETVEKVHLFLSERLEGVNKDLLEKALLEFKDTVAADPDPFSTVKTKTKPKTPRPPTAYNLFIKDTMEKLKKEHPDMANTSLMSLAATKWNEFKQSQATTTDATTTKKTKKVVKKSEKAA